MVYQYKNVDDGFPGLTFGADPELFVVNEKDEFVCADGLIPGTKKEPFKVKNGAVQVDGMAAEFNIDPVDNFDEFIHNTRSVYKQLKGMLPKGYDLKAVPIAKFSEKVWNEAPDHAKILGCDPDYNAWTRTVNPMPDEAQMERTRTASGHLHIGWTKDADIDDPLHQSQCTDLVRALDWYLGYWGSTSKEGPEGVERRNLYGKAGAMRFKPYGVEYRVLSNFWLGQGTETLKMMWNRMQRAVQAMANNKFLYSDGEYKHGYGKFLVASINSGKINEGMELNRNVPLVRSR